MRIYHRLGLDAGAQKVLDALNDRMALLEEMLPLNVNQKVMDIVEGGGIYIGGRDKQYRPYMVIKPAVIFGHSPEASELITAAMIQFYFMDKYMLLDGHIENLLQLQS